MIKQNGVETWSTYPYESADNKLKGECRFNPANIGGICNGYKQIKKSDEADLKKIVATGNFNGAFHF